MKIIIYKFFVFVIVVSFISCNNEQQNKERKSNDKPIIMQYKSGLEEYSNQDTKPRPYSLLIKKITYPEKTIYTYNYKNYYRADTLVLFKDSIIMNNEKLLLLRTKTISFKGKNQEVKKYQYIDRSSNIFIVDSLGIILQHGQTHPYGTVRRDYKTEEYRALNNEIIKDSLFYSFEFDFKHLKEYLKLKNKNSR